VATAEAGVGRMNNLWLLVILGYFAAWVVLAVFVGGWS
jgi:hypothetical protein